MKRIKNVPGHPIFKIIFSIGLTFLIFLSVQNFISKPVFYGLNIDKSIADSLINYVSTIVLICCYYFIFKLLDRREIGELSTNKMFRDLSLGLFFGYGVLSVVVGVLFLSGNYTVLPKANLDYLLAPLSLLVFMAMFEEIFFRLVIYRIIEEWKGTYIALMVMALLFTTPHLFNDNVSLTSIFFIPLFGIAHGLMFTFTRKLWFPFAFHLGWNFAQPFYGSNLSGIEGEYIFEGTFDGAEWLTGSAFGIEDSILTISLLLLITIAFFYISRKENKIKMAKSK